MYRHVRRGDYEMKFQYGLVLVMIAGFLYVGCNSEKATSIQDVLSKLEKGQSLFSYIYIDDPPEGTRLRIEIHPIDVESPCALHKIDADVSAETPFWYLSIKTADIIPGTYEVDPYFDEMYGQHTAGILLNNVKSNEIVDKYSAVSGNVEIIEAPQNSDEWHENIRLKANIRAKFSKNAMRTKECNVACMDVDGSAENCHRTCTCIDSYGKESLCSLFDNDAGIEEETCCIQMHGPTIEFENSIVASPCAYACTWVIDLPHLARYCQELI